MALESINWNFSWDGWIGLQERRHQKERGWWLGNEKFKFENEEVALTGNDKVKGFTIAVSSWRE